MRAGVGTAALVLVGTMGAVGAGLPTVSPAGAATFKCAPVAILTLRGSGEPAGSGPVLDGILEEVRRTTLTDGYSPADVPVYPVPYPAVPAEQYLSTDRTDLLESIDEGVLFSSVIMDAYLEQCGATSRFLLMGYSQGVIVAREIATRYPQAQIAGVFGVGDPAQHGGEPGINGVGRDGDGIYRWLLSSEDSTSRLDEFYGAGVPYSMWCHADDWICNFYNPDRGEDDGINPLFQTYDHHYPSDPTEGIVMAARIAVMLRDATTAPPPPADEIGVRAIDLVFAIDTTGSMDPYIQQARRKARTTTDELVAGGNDVRVGVVGYRDHGDVYVARTFLPLTDDLTRLRPTLAGLEADGGGDTPESVYSGIVEALGSDWRPDAARSVVVLGDARAHDPEPGTRLTLAKVAARAVGVVGLPALPPTLGGAAGEASFTAGARVTGAVEVDVDPGPVAVFGLADDDELLRQMEELARRTGGSADRLAGASDTASALTEMMASITGAPRAALDGPAVAFAGLATVLTATRSTASAPPLYYEFDADGDGTFERGSSGPAAVVHFPAPGHYRPTVRVTDAEGRMALATAEVDVVDADELRATPAPPQAAGDEATEDDSPWTRWWPLAAAGAMAILGTALGLSVYHRRARSR